jgi:hypothetical protein
MARTFTITCAAGTIPLEGSARGECAFTVTNTSAAPVRAAASTVALDGRAHDWFGILGDAQRELAPGQTVQFTVSISPAGAPPGRYCFRLDVATVVEQGTGERCAGPEACVELTKAADPRPAPPRPFPWLWLIIAAVALLVISLLLWLFLGRGPSADTQEKPAEPRAADAPAAPTPAAGEDAGPRDAAPKDAEDLARRWQAAFDRRDAKGLAALTSPPASIGGQRADDQNAITKAYAALLRERDLVREPASIAVRPRKPVIAPIRELGRKVPPEAGDLRMGEDDLAAALTLSGTDQRLVLLIRRGPPISIAGVIR